MTPPRTRLPVGRLAVVAVLATLVAGSTGLSSAPATPSLSVADLRWLERVTFGPDSAAVARFQRLGREKFLDEQLHPPASDPEPLSGAIRAMPMFAEPVEKRVKNVFEELKRISTLPPDEQQEARDAQNVTGNQLIYLTARRHLMRALYSPSQLREQLTWFWMNHFSIYAGKGYLRWSLPEFEERVRAGAFGRFADLVLATATSPTMLEFLDNHLSVAGNVNENYGRELMELHTLGVSGGPSGSHYTQRDVQELARVLTGAGINVTGTMPDLPRSQRPLYVRRGLFEFNPARHDFATKTVLGQKILGQGFPEIEEAVNLLCREPATARFISHKLATYFVGDEPPAGLVDRMVATFQQTDGSIEAVVRQMLLDPDLLADLAAPEPRNRKLKDPMQFVVSSLRLAYEGRMFTNYHHVVNWVAQLGEPLYLRTSPDGYPMTESAWSSPAQLVERFEVARAIAAGNAPLFTDEDAKAPGPGTTGPPALKSPFFAGTLEPTLGPRTLAALGKASSQFEWDLFLLASPDWMMR